MRGPPGRHEKYVCPSSEDFGRNGYCAEGPRGSSDGGSIEGSQVCDREPTNVVERERDLDNVCDVNLVTEPGGDGDRFFSLKCTGDRGTGSVTRRVIGSGGEATGEGIIGGACREGGSASPPRISSRFGPLKTDMRYDQKSINCFRR
jgi:hypothetical protein